MRIYACASGGISVLNSEGNATAPNGRTYGYDNPYYVELNGFTPGQKANNLSDWHFQAVMAAEANYGRIHFKAYDMSSNTGDTPVEDDLIGEAKKYILIPGSLEKLPQIQLTGSAPNVFHTEGHRVFNVTGMKFAGLEAEANDRYSLKLTRKDGGAIRGQATSLTIPQATFTINEDGSGLMAVSIDGKLPEGEYKLTVDYTDPNREDIDAKALEFLVVEDTRYRCETYGLVIVYREDSTDNDGSHQDYLVGTFADEAMYNDWKAAEKIDESDILMIFRGVFDDLTYSLPDDAASELNTDETYAVYLMAALSDDPTDVVTMSNALQFSCYEPGSNIVIKQIKKTVEAGSGGDSQKNSVKVDLNCKVTTAGVGTRVYSGRSWR